MKCYIANILLVDLFSKGMRLAKTQSQLLLEIEVNNFSGSEASDIRALLKRPQEGIPRSPRHRRTICRWNQQRPFSTNI